MNNLFKNILVLESLLTHLSRQVNDIVMHPAGNMLTNANLQISCNGYSGVMPPTRHRHSFLIIQNSTILHFKRILGLRPP